MDDNKRNEDNNRKGGSSFKYGAHSIKKEEGVEAHRKRVSRFLGGSGVKGIENQAMEVVDNGTDEAFTSYQLKMQGEEELQDVNIQPIVNFEITKDWDIIVEDFGRGIPCEEHPETGESALYLICESDSAGGKGRGTQGYGDDTAGIHGAGLAVSKSCTEFFKLEVNSLSGDGKYEFEYRKGRRVGEIKRIGDLDRTPTGEKITGTKITYHYDPELFSLTMGAQVVDQPYYKHTLRDRLKYILLGSKVDAKINFKFRDDEVEVLTPSDFTPQMFLKDNEPFIVEISDKMSIKDNYSAEIFISLMSTRLDGEVKTVVNRLNTTSATANDVLVDIIIDVINDLLDRDKSIEPKYRGMRINKTMIRSKLSALIILKLQEAEFSGQTKSHLVSNRFLVDFRSKLEGQLRGNREFIEKVYSVARDILVQEKIMENERKKMQEKMQKMKELQQAKKEEEKFIADLKGDARLRSKRKKESRITIKDSPMPRESSTLVYIEGKSGGVLINDLHDEGEVPVAVALLEGKIPNVFDKEKMTEITIDNRTYCLEAGYGDIGIYVDGDVDGNHIRILICYQIWKYARHYLKEGKVYIIPAPYSKVRINKPLILDLYGEMKPYPAGNVYTYSAKEHQSLMKAGAIFIKKYKGLADSPFTPTEAIKNRENWIRIKPVIEEDIILIEKVLKEKSEFKTIFMAEVFSGRQFFSKKVSNSKREIELDSKELNKLLDDSFISSKPEMMNYVDSIDRRYLNKFDIF